jgi:GNAT superfamily N-acetyltransferase
MLRIRKVADGTTAANRSAIEAAQKIMREQFPAMPPYDIDKLPEQLANPLKHRFVTRLFVAENARDQTLGVALLLHAPDIGFSYLELISAAPGRTGYGIGATLYERVREEARALGTQLYFESSSRRSGAQPQSRDPCAQCGAAQILRALRRAADHQHIL